MRPPNYHQARKQKEQRRKLRQQEKQQKRSARVRPDEQSKTTSDPSAVPEDKATG
jgi:hypothetical protein